MIEDLATAGDLKLDADVLVVGGGTLGLVIAARLAEREVKVVCLESGGWQQDDPVHPLNIIEQKGTPYAGATEGRFRCLGGSSTRWGGLLSRSKRTILLTPHGPSDRWILNHGLSK